MSLHILVSVLYMDKKELNKELHDILVSTIYHPFLAFYDLTFKISPSF